MQLIRWTWWASGADGRAKRWSLPPAFSLKFFLKSFKCFVTFISKWLRCVKDFTHWIYSFIIPSTDPSSHRILSQLFSILSSSDGQMTRATNIVHYNFLSANKMDDTPSDAVTWCQPPADKRQLQSSKSWSYSYKQGLFLIKMSQHCFDFEKKSYGNELRQGRITFLKTANCSLSLLSRIVLYFVGLTVTVGIRVRDLWVSSPTS